MKEMDVKKKCKIEIIIFLLATLFSLTIRFPFPSLLTEMKSTTELSADKNDCKLYLNFICDWSEPEEVAIEYHDVGMTRLISYSDLNDARKKVENLLSSVIESYGFVGINSDVTRHCVPALMLGIQDQGSAFVNLPSINKREVCHKLGSTLLFSRCMDLDGNLICELDVHGETIKLLKLKKMSEECESDTKENEFAYAITTSGSTGAPKIVKVPHASIVPNILDLRKLFLLSKADKVAQITALTFDPSIVEIFLSLSSGSTLFLTSNEIIDDPAELLKLIFQCEVTLLQTTPSLWQHRWNDDELRKTIFGKNSRLRVLLLGGEPPPKSDTISALKHCENRTKIYNIYGITEVSCWASVAEIRSTNREESKDHGNLGKPLSQTIFQVRNKHGDVICKGEGILHVGSDSRICVVNDENSASLVPPVFRNTGDLVTINDNGDLFYKGRCDRIVKRFGVRIDLTELESAVSKLSFVKNSVALWDDKAHKLYLCVSTSDPNKVKFLNELRMREELNKELRKLPAVYQPDRVKYFTDIQLTANGKICTKNLLKICRNGGEEIRLANSIGVKRVAGSAGEMFLKIWQNHFSLASEDSGFLDHGGNSVKAIQISNELSVALGSQFPELIGLLLKNETLSKCVDYVGKKVGQFQLASANDAVAGTSNLSSEEFESVSKRKKYHSMESEKIREHDASVWQKCRGKLSGEKMQETDLQRSFDTADRIFGPKLTVEYSRDLKKCVDASPTVFGYPSGDIYTSVGSHAGVVLTEELNRPDSIKYEINLPDRIEASVLALKDFKGIVGCYDSHVYCVDLKTGEIIWKFKTGDTVKCTAIASNDEKSIFVGSYDKYLYNISIKDGKEIWKLKGSEGSVSATPRICSKFGSIVFGTLDGTCMSLKQNNGSIIWETKFKDPIFSAPVLLGNELNIVFCSVSGEVKCFESETGIENWRYKIDGNVFSHLVLRKNSNAETEDLIIGSMNKIVYCLSVPLIASIPVLKYSITFECPIFATPYCEGEFLIVADTGGNLSLLNSFDGKLFTSLKLNGNVFSSPVIIGEFIVVGCRDNNMYVVKINK